ncbi:MAG: AlpA family phage regulatory protein [Thiohalomonadaceae bacterium]
MKRSSIYARMDAKSPYFDPTFPRPVPLGGRSVGWVEAEIDEWVEARINARQAA